MASPYKTLFLALQASSFMSGVSLAFGEEAIADQSKNLPYVVMVPRGGPSQEPGYARDGSQLEPQDLDVNTEDLWEFAETFQFYCWNVSTNGAAQLPVDHAEATRSLRLLVLSALRDQRDMLDANGQAYRGLSFRVLRSDWETMEGAVNRYGRALIVSVQIDIPEVMSIPTGLEQTVETTEFDPAINYSIG